MLAARRLRKTASLGPVAPGVAMLAALAMLAGCPAPAQSGEEAGGGEASEAKPAEGQPAEGESAAGAGEEAADAAADADAGANTASEEIPKWTGDDRDPPWYHPSMIPGAKELTNTGADVTGKGSLSRSIRLELPAGSTAESCIEDLRKKVGDSFGSEAAPAKDQGGQKQVVGTAPDGSYRYTLMCGQVEDKVIAFVGYYID